jgi:ankyrin repeat protein
MGNQNRGDFMKNQKSLFMMLLMMQCMYVVAMDKKWQEPISAKELQSGLPALRDEWQKEVNKLLVEAAEHKNIAQAEQALKLGAEINKGYPVNEYDPHSKNRLALYEAVGKNDPAMVEFLLNHGADPTQDGCYNAPVLLKAMTSKVSILINLLKHVSPEYLSRCAQTWPLVHTAAKYGNLDVVAQLLERGIDVDLKDGMGRTALQVIVPDSPFRQEEIKENLEVIKFLLNHGAQIPKKWLPYSYAQEVDLWGNTFDLLPGQVKKIFSETINQRAKAEIQRRQANELLIEAVGQGDIAKVKQALRLGAEINKRCPLTKYGLRSNRNRLALYEAIIKNDPVMVEFLLNNGADPIELESDGGDSAFFIALGKDVRIVKSLLNRVSPQHMEGLLKINFQRRSVLCENFEVVEELLKRGAAINLKDRVGKAILSNLINIEWYVLEMMEKGYLNRLKKTVSVLLKHGIEIPENLQPYTEGFSQLPVKMQQILQAAIKHNSRRDLEYRKEFLSKICNVQ